MQKKFYSILIFLSIAICMTFAGVKVNAMENQTISKDLKVVGEDISKIGNDILNNMKSLKDLSSNEKSMLIIYFQADFQTAVEFENKGYSAAEAIKLSSIGYKHGLNIEQVEKLLKNYSSIEEFANDMTKMKHYFKFDKISKEYTNEIKMLLYQGYSADELNSAYRISKVLNLKIEKIIKKDKSNNYNQRLDEELKNNREDEVKIIKQLDKNYFVDMTEVLKYCKSKKISIEDLSKKIITYESERNKLYGENTTQTLTASNASGTQKVDYSKYFNAPFVYSGEKNESISLNSGSLSYNSIDYVLQGKNGLNLEIASCYNSSSSGLYEEGGYSEPYVFPEFQSKYAAIIKKTVFSIKSESNVTLVSETEINNGLFWIEQEATNANNNFISTHPNISEKQADGTILATSYTPIVCPVIVTVLVPSTRIVSTVGATTYEESHAQMGAGWSWGFSSVQIDENDQKYLHLGSGQVYKVEWTPSADDSNLVKYTLKDLRFENDTTFSNGVMYSSYVLFHKNGNKEYFGQDGRLLGIVDKYNNKITFQHTVEGFSGVHSIAKIIDSVGRVVTITYNFTAQTREIVLTLPDSNTIKYILEPLAGHNGEYVLKRKIDQMGRETVFDYQVREAKFNLASKDVNYGVGNFYANLISITYPTKAQSIFSYEKVTGNMNLDGAMEYFRVVSKKNIVNGVDSNMKGYSYEGNHTGFPSLNNPENLQDTYTYKTSIADGKTVTINTFNNKHLLINQQIKDTAGNLLREVKYEYDTNKLPIKENTTLYSEGGKLTQKETSASYNEFGDKTSFKNELGGETITDYDLKYHLPKLTYNIADYVITNKVEYNIDASTGNIMSIKKHHFENGIDKSILTNYEYDAFGNIIKEKLTQKDGKIVEKNFEYSSDYNNAYLTKTSTVVNDYINNKPQTVIESYTYDFNTGNKTTYIDAKGMQYKYEYDKLGRLIKDTNPDLTSKSIVYCENNNISKNLLMNPGFEKYTGTNGIADEWFPEVTSTVDAKYSINNSIKFEGQNSQTISITEAREGGYAAVYQPLDVKEGERYTISIRTSHNIESTCVMQVNCFSNEWKLIKQYSLDLSADFNNENKISISMPTGANHITICPLIIVGQGQSGYLQIDNVIVNKADNLLVNPGFEIYTGTNGIADGWMPEVTSTVDAKFSINNSIKFEGQNSQTISVTGTREGGYAAVYQPLDVKEGETYAIYARTSHNIESTCVMQVNCFSSEWKLIKQFSLNLSTDFNEENKILISMPIGVNYITVCPLIIVGQGQTGYLQIDNLVVIREQIDDFLNSTIVSNENKFSIRQQYDGLGRLIKKEEQNSAGGWTTLEEIHYNTHGEVDWTKNALGNITTYQYDVFGRLIKTIFPDSSFTQTFYYDGENKKIVYNEEGYGQCLVYDNSGNLTAEWKGRTDENNVLRYFGKVYQNDKFGKIISTTDLNHKKILDYSYDDLGRMISVTNAIGETTSYEYNSLDNIIKQTTAGGSVTTKYYDELGRLYQETDPLGKSEYTSYDLAGNVAVSKDRNGTIFTYSYDELNRLKTESNTKNTIPLEFTYDSTGKTLSANNLQGYTTYEYYPNGLLKKEINPDMKFIYYEYNLDGTRSKMIDHFGKETSYGYDLRGRLKTVTVDSKTTTYEYYNDGSRKSITYPEGVKEEYFYNECNNLTRLINKKADGTIISNFTYTYDDMGNQTSKIEAEGKTNFTYDSLNRVRIAVNENSSRVSYTYDKNGNIDMETTFDFNPEGYITTKDYTYDSKLFRLDSLKTNSIKLSTLNIKASTTKALPDQYITFDISNTLNISDIGINQMLNEAVWTTSSQKMILQATTGKTIKGVIPKASWDQMLSDETIIIRATLLNRVLEISIGKESNITLKSLSITPLSVLFSTNDCKSFTLSGTMSDGSPAPLEILSKAIWRVGSVTNFRLLEKVGSSVSVETVEITGPGDTYFSPRNRNEETINAIGGIGDTTLVTSILSATIGDISATATLKRYSSTSGGGTRPPRPGEGGEFSLEDGKEGINLDTSVEITTPAGLTIGDLANTDKEESLLNFDEVNTIQTNLQSATLIADIPVAATTYYIYDNNNNLIETRNGTIGGTVIASYEYNEFNQLVKLANQSGLTSYTYNPSGLRTSKTLGDSTTNYYYDGDNVIIETINGNFTARNIMGINPIARETNTSKLYYLYNGHADVIAMVDASGTVINSYSYDIYGNIISANEADGANPIRYAGQYYDNESDMYYLRARYYDPGLMRFITEDSYKGDVKDPLSLNLYSYCVGNPIELFDNEGHAPSRIDNEFGASESSFWQRIQGGLDNTKPIGNFEIPTSGEILANLLSSAFGNIRLVTKTVDTSLGKNGELILWPKKYETSKFPKAGRILSKTGTVLTLVSNLLDIANTWTEDNGNTVSKRMVKTGVQIGGAVVAYNLGSLNARLAGGLVLGEAPSAGLTTIGLVVVVGLDVVEGIVISWVQDKIYEIVDIH